MSDRPLSPIMKLPSRRPPRTQSANLPVIPENLPSVFSTNAHLENKVSELLNIVNNLSVEVSFLRSKVAELERNYNKI